MLLYTSLRTFGISCWPRSGVCPPARRALTRAVRIAASHTCQSGAWRLCHLNNAPLAHRKSWRLRAHSRTAPEVFSLPLNLGLPASCRRFPPLPFRRGEGWGEGSVAQGRKARQMAGGFSPATKERERAGVGPIWWNIAPKRASSPLPSPPFHGGEGVLSQVSRAECPDASGGYPRRNFPWKNELKPTTRVR